MRGIKKLYVDSDALNTYYCREGNCWHVGNKKPMLAQNPAVRVPGPLSVAPDFEPPPEWLQTETIQTPTPPSHEATFGTGDVASHERAPRQSPRQVLTPVRGPMPATSKTDKAAIHDPTKARTNLVIAIELLKKLELDDTVSAQMLRQWRLELKKGLCKVLVEWLLSFKSGEQISDYDRSALARINTELSLENWLSARNEKADIEEKLEIARLIEVEAAKESSQAARFGVVSIWFMDAEKAGIATNLRQKLKEAKAARELIERSLAEKYEELKDNDTGFHSGCFQR